MAHNTPKTVTHGFVALPRNARRTSTPLKGFVSPRNRSERNFDNRRSANDVSISSYTKGEKRDQIGFEPPPLPWEGNSEMNGNSETTPRSTAKYKISAESVSDARVDTPISPVQTPRPPRKVGAHEFTVSRKLYPLHAAVFDGDMQALLAMLREGLHDVNEADSHNRSPLHWAALTGHFDILEHLLQVGAHPGALDDSYATPLHLAAVEGHVRAVQLLLTHGADVACLAADYVTCLHLTTSVDVAKVLLTHGGDVNASDAHQRTPLHSAILNKHLPLVKLLCNNCADLNAADEDGNTPVHIAAGIGKLDIVQYLVGKGVYRDVLNKNGWTALHVICRGGYGDSSAKGMETKICVCLVNAKFDVNIRGPNEVSLDRSPLIWSPLHMACQAGLMDVVRVLVELGHADINASDSNKDTPLHVASRKGFSDIVDYLVGENADLTSQNDIGQVPMTLAGDQRTREVYHKFSTKQALDDTQKVIEESKMCVNAKTLQQIREAVAACQRHGMMQDLIGVSQKLEGQLKEHSHQVVAMNPASNGGCNNKALVDMIEGYTLALEISQLRLENMKAKWIKSQGDMEETKRVADIAKEEMLNTIQESVVQARRREHAWQAIMSDKDQLLAEKDALLRQSATQLAETLEEKNRLQRENQELVEAQRRSPTWIPDERCTACGGCGKSFSVFRRKHHCRVCGGVFCDACTPVRVSLPHMGYTSPMRVCNECQDKT